MPFSIIVGTHFSNKAIGAKGKIPWKCRADMKFFKEITCTVKDSTKMNAVIMGRKTFESLPSPLPNRVNVVLTKRTNSSLLIPPSSDKLCDKLCDKLYKKKGVNFAEYVVLSDFDETIEILEQDTKIETIFVIGGEMVYREAINHPKCEKIYLNEVNVVCDLSECDAFFPDIDKTKYELVETVIIDPTVTSFVFTPLKIYTGSYP